MKRPRKTQNARSAAHLHWTAEELATLRREWTLLGMRQLRAKLPGRTWHAIRRKAAALGLGDSQTQGLASITALAQRYGLCRPTMHRILERAGVKLVRQHPNGKTQESKRVEWKVYADEADAAEAFARWEREETAEQAAARLGKYGRSLRLRALSAGLATFGAPVRLLPEQWDALAAPKRALRSGAALFRRSGKAAAR